MKYTIWLTIMVWACLAPGCSSDVGREPDPEAGSTADPIGFTFKSAPGSFSSFGWSGALHNIVQEPETPFGVKTTDCRNGLCRFEGPTDPRGEVKRRRCLFQTSKVCTTQADCPTLGSNPTPCVYVYDTPISTPLRGKDGKFGACAWSFIPLADTGSRPIEGSLNLTSGALNLDRFTLNLVLNINADDSFRGACAECAGDSRPNDGVRNGTCQLATHLGDTNPAGPEMSPDIGQPCDVHRVGTLNGYEGNYSMDCSPTVVPDPSRSRPPLSLGGAYTSAGKVLVLSAKSPDCTTGGKCFCGMCGDSAIACMSDDECGKAKCEVPKQADCDPNLPGSAEFLVGMPPYQCKKDAMKVAAASNSCVDGVCRWDPDKGVGACEAKVGGGSSAERGPTIGCYPSEMDAMLSIPGSASRDDRNGITYRVETGGASCIPAANTTAAASLNSQVGLPGLLFQKRNFQIIPEYAQETK
jgi:hypothetical protein